VSWVCGEGRVDRARPMTSLGTSLAGDATCAFSMIDTCGGYM